MDPSPTPDPAPIRPRRSDRAMDDAWIGRFLERAPVGVLALATAEAPHLNSNLFVYDRASQAIYLHTSRVGAMPAAVGEGVAAGFHIMEMGRLLPADEALEFSVEYAGVTLFGRLERIEDGAVAREWLQRLLDKYAPHLRPGRDYRPTSDADLKRTAVYRLAIERWSGKRKVVADDFPGAFVYPAGSAIHDDG